MIEPTGEPLLSDRWQGESETAPSDRPGIVASLVRYRAIVVAVTLLGAVAGYGIAQLLPVRYQAQAVLITSDPGDPSVLGGGNALAGSDLQVYLAKQADIMTSTVVLERTLEHLGSHQSPADIKHELNVQPSANMASISITATSTDPRSAAALANAVGTAYKQVTQESAAADASRAIASLEKLRIRYQADLDASPKSPGGLQTSRQQQLFSQITDVQQREQDITTQAGVYASGVEYFEPAAVPTTPTQPKPKLDAALAALLALLAAAAWAWRAAARDPRAEGRGDPARILEAALLGEVPPQPAPQMATGTPPAPDPALEAAYHLIVASMEHELAGVGGKSIAVTSVGPGDSKTSTTLQIGNAASHENRMILLIDADVRTRHLSHRVDPQPVDVVAFPWERAGRWPRPTEARRRSTPVPEGDPAEEYIDRLVSTDSGMVLPLASNPTDPGDPTVADRAVDVRHAVRSIGDRFDLVLIDAPPLLKSRDALDITKQADGVVLVVSHRVALSDLREVHDRLAFVKTPLLGYVYVRPPDLSARTLWERVTRRVTPSNR